MSSPVDLYLAWRAWHAETFGVYAGTNVPITPIAFVPDARMWVRETSAELPIGHDVTGRFRCTGEGEPWEPFEARAMSEAGADFGAELADGWTPEKLLGWASTPLRRATAAELWELLRECSIQFESLGVVSDGWDAYGELGGAVVESIEEGEPVEFAVDSIGKFAEFTGAVAGKAAAIAGRAAGTGAAGLLGGLLSGLGGFAILGIVAAAVVWGDR